jgi:hypothetical protein
MSSNGPSKNATVKGVELHLDMISAGLLQAFPADEILEVGGKKVKVAALQKEIDSRRTVYKTVRDLRVQLRSGTQEKHDQYEADVALVNDVKIAVKGALGRTNPELTRFGFKPDRPRTQLTPEERVLRAARARETRAARHTLGARQKASIKGEVNEVSVVEDGNGAKSVPNDTTPAADPKPTPPAATGKVA